MTNKEAVEGIERNICTHMDWCGDTNCGECEVNLAVEALEKQIPKMPDYEGDGYVDGFPIYDTWICPTCGRYYELDCNDDYIYCPHCGQRINWSTLER